MSKKNKNKNKTQPKTIVPINKTNELSIGMKDEIEFKDIELQEESQEHGVQPIEFSSHDSENKYVTSKKDSDIEKYWDYLKRIGQSYDSLKERLSKLIEENKKIENENIERSDLLKTQIQDYKTKQNELNESLEKVREQELKFLNGDYTDVIRNFLENVQKTEKSILESSENAIKLVGETHLKNINEFSELMKEYRNLKKESESFEIQKQKLHIDREVYEESVYEKIEDEYQEKLSDLENRNKKVNEEYKRLFEKNKETRKLIDELESVFTSEEFRNDFVSNFGSTTAEEILKSGIKKNEDIESFRSEINHRPTIDELNTQKQKVELLEKSIQDLREKLNEKDFLELKKHLDNSDKYKIELNILKNSLEVLQIREDNYKNLVDTLNKTINELSGDKNKKSQTFEFASDCDNEMKLEAIGNSKYPENLSDLVSYLECKMASSEEKPFYYSQETIRIFLAGLHMSPITILQGISGTGKTSLPREFSKALVSNTIYKGSDKTLINSTYRICPIQSGWRDNSDLLGYYNSFEHQYRETDFFKALYEAGLEKYSNKLFLIILDEMNLSRPEHYFADFLSMIEQSPSERYVTINAPKATLPKLILENKLKIPRNVRFIGTANHDETTLEFAPKTYDRSNVMEMPKNHPGKSDTNYKSDQDYDVSYNWLEEKFIEAESVYKNESDKFKKFVSDLEKDLLSEKGIGVGNRFENQAEKFISVFLHAGIKENIKKDIAIAADHLITSRLLRTLKNRYDLDRKNLEDFKSKFKNKFKDEFENEPTFGLLLLETEINKK